MDSQQVKLSPQDSLDLQKKASDFIRDELGNLYFQFNPDMTCVMFIEKGTVAKGSYKIKESENSLTFILKKDQKVDGEVVKTNGKEKQKFFYSFNNDLLSLDSDDGAMRFLLKKE